MGDVPFIESLVKDYKKRAESSGHWTDYVKAHGLANFCLAKDSTEERCKLVYSIEESWYNGRHPLSYVEHQQLIHQHKSKLKSYRDETRLDYQQLDVEVEKLNEFDIFSEKNLNCAQLVSKQIFAASKESSQRIVKLSESIISSSVDILQRIGLTAPCKFAVIGLGSLAKGEATPYSDLEYAFIVERDDARYFEKLAVDSYFRIGNLGETPLKHFDIAELAKGCTPNTQNDIAAGYRIDGLTKKAGNIPTGNGKDGSQSLTLTVDKFIELYKSSARSPFNGIAGDLSDMLASSVVIYTNEGEKSQLYEEFVRARIAFELRQDNKTDVNQKRFDSFNSDIASYTFLPEFVQFQPPNNLEIKVKTDIFRYPTLLANNIKMLMGWNIRYSWDIFSNLHRQGILSNENSRYLNIVLALSVFLRTRAYISRGYQAEFVSLLPTVHDSPDTQYSSSRALFVVLGSLLVPIKQSIKSLVKKKGVATAKESVKETVTLILQNIMVSKTDYLQQAEVCYFTGQYSLAKMAMDKLLPTSVESVSCDQFLKIIAEACKPAELAEKYVELCCYILYYTGCYASAISYFQWIIDHRQENLGLLQLLTAHCQKEIGDYMAALCLVEEAKQYLRKQGTYPYKTEINHEDAYCNYINIGAVYAEMGEYKQALEYFNRALDMSIAVHGYAENSNTAIIFANIGNSWRSLGDYTQSIEYLTKALQILNVIHGADCNNSNIANVYNGFGNTYSEMRYDALSLEYFTKSLDINEAMYGVATNHPDIANCYLNIGNAHGYLTNYELSLEYYTKSLDMKKAIYGTNTNHPHIADSYNNIGAAYNRLGKHTSALEYSNKALDMRKAIHGATSNQPHLPVSYNCIGAAYRGLGKYALSLEYFTKALDMQKMVHGADSNHPDIADSYNIIGGTYSNMGYDALSLEYYTKSFDMNKAIYGATTNHPHIASSYNRISKAHVSLGSYQTSLEYSTKSLSMNQAIHGASENRPCIFNNYINIGNAYRGLGNHTLSLKYYIKSLDMGKAMHGDNANHHTIVGAYNNIGAVYYCLGNHTLALEYYIKTLAMQEALYGATTNHTDIANSYSNIGSSLHVLCNYTSAIEYHTKALDMRYALYGAPNSHPLMVDGYNNIAVAYRGLSDLCKLALQHFGKVSGCR